MRALGIGRSGVTAFEGPAPGGSVGGGVGKDDGTAFADFLVIGGETGHRIRVNGDIVGLRIIIGAAGISHGQRDVVGARSAVGNGMRALGIGRSGVTAFEGPAPGGSVGGGVGKDDGIAFADFLVIGGETGHREWVHGDGLSGVGAGAAVGIGDGYIQGDGAG